MRKWLSELAYKGEVFFSRAQGIAYDHPSRNGEHLLVRRLAPTVHQALDLGANVGDWTAELLRVTRGKAQIVCVEPDPRNAAILRTRFDGQRAVSVLEAAVSDRSGSAMFVAGDAPGNGIGYVERDCTKGASVRGLTLEGIVSDLGDPEIDLVKCDVEGEEMAVLAGAGRLFERSRIGVMQVEYNVTWHRAGRSLRELFAFAERYQYALLLATPMGFARLPSYGEGIEDYRMRNIVLARQDKVTTLSAFGPTGRARVEHHRAQP
jgi:FkbM family methyltransferase